MKTFFETLVALYSGGLPPEFWLHVASLIGSFMGLIFLPPDGWKAGVTQVIASYFISHYVSLAMPKDYPPQLVRFLLGLGGYGIGQGFAKLIKQFRNDPDGTIWESLLKVVVKFRELFPKKK